MAPRRQGVILITTQNHATRPGHAQNRCGRVRADARYELRAFGTPGDESLPIRIIYGTAQEHGAGESSDTGATLYETNDPAAIRLSTAPQTQTDWQKERRDDEQLR